MSFVNFPLKQPSNRKLYVVPLSGGAPRRVLETFPGPVSVSFDGNRVAAVEKNESAGRDELWISDTATAQRHLLASYKYPDRFARPVKPAWSPDRKFIAYAAEQHDAKGFLVRLFVMDVGTGAARAVNSPRWQGVQYRSDPHDKSALALVAQERIFVPAALVCSLPARRGAPDRKRFRYVLWRKRYGEQFRHGLSRRANGVQYLRRGALAIGRIPCKSRRAAAATSIFRGRPTATSSMPPTREGPPTFG